MTIKNPHSKVRHEQWAIVSEEDAFGPDCAWFPMSLPAIKGHAERI